jgi:hypothetical protein
MSLFLLTSDIFIKSILEKISLDYNIDFKELNSKYFGTPVLLETVALSKMKKTDLVKECESLGIKSDGSVVQLKERIKKSRAEAGIKAVRGSKKKKAAKKVAPVHNHDLCIEVQKDCPLCQSHGNIFHLTEVEYEEVTT